MVARSLLDLQDLKFKVQGTNSRALAGTVHAFAFVFSIQISRGTF